MKNEEHETRVELTGNTRRVYLYALKNSKVGVREVQRSLGLSNASLAQYHINKLVEMGLLRDESGEYRVVSEVKVDVLRDFTRFGTILVPRFVFYAVLFTFLAAYLAITAVRFYASEPIISWFALFLALASGIFWYEAIRAWRFAT